MDKETNTTIQSSHLFYFKNKLIFVNFKNFDLSKIQKLVETQLGTTKLDLGYVFLNDKQKILGYCILLEEENKQIKIDWIYAISGYGTDFLKRLERTLLPKYSKIILNVSIDPNENKEIVKRRINFYIKNNYRVYDITFRKKYGPLLKMCNK